MKYIIKATKNGNYKLLTHRTSKTSANRKRHRLNKTKKFKRRIRLIFRRRYKTPQSPQNQQNSNKNEDNFQKKITFEKDKNIFNFNEIQPEPEFERVFDNNFGSFNHMYDIEYDKAFHFYSEEKENDQNNYNFCPFQFDFPPNPPLLLMTMPFVPIYQDNNIVESPFKPNIGNVNPITLKDELPTKCDRLEINGNPSNINFNFNFSNEYNLPNNPNRANNTGSISNGFIIRNDIYINNNVSSNRETNNVANNNRNNNNNVNNSNNHNNNNLGNNINGNNINGNNINGNNNNGNNNNRNNNNGNHHTNDLDFSIDFDSFLSFNDSDLLGGNRRRRRNYYNILFGNYNPSIQKKKLKAIKENLSKVKFKERKDGDNQEDTCAICMEKFKKTQNIYRLPCEHIFHVRCLNKELKNRQKCPMCRNVLK